MKRALYGLLVLGLTVLGLIIYSLLIDQQSRETTMEPSSDEADEGQIELVTNLEIPWEAGLLPNGEMLISERVGRLSRVTKNQGKQTIAEIEEVEHIGEGGLMGMAIDPEYSQNNYLYLYFTYEDNQRGTLNRVVKYMYKDGVLTQDKILVDAIPGARNHNGGRLAFGPDGYLYISTGDAAQPSLAQDTDSLAGKILRVDKDGQAAAENPFGNRVYSFGHRNPQGLAWVEGQLWATEHGPLAHDEINQIEMGGNYGWPIISGTEQRSGMITPVIESGLNTWAPAGLEYYQGKLYFGGLRGSAMYIFDPNNPEEIKRMLSNEYGRIRLVKKSSVRGLYIGTSNRDGRGNPREGDDKVVLIDF